MSVTLHTNLGDLKVEVFCEDVPRTAENFLALCASEYYNGTSFHRNIKGFMIQVRSIHAASCVARRDESRLLPCLPREVDISFLLPSSLVAVYARLVHAQGGDPTGSGRGGHSIWGGKFPDEIRDTLKHTNRGILSMANSGPNSNNSQFFITYTKCPHLNGKNTIFGKVIDGFTVLDMMEKTPGDEMDRPLAEIRINKVTIHANPLAR